MILNNEVKKEGFITELKNILNSKIESESKKNRFKIKL
jgi:hypothetical protein